MFTLNGFVLSALLIVFGALLGVWYGNLYPEENKTRQWVYFGIGLAIALLASILLVAGVLHF